MSTQTKCPICDDPTYVEKALAEEVLICVETNAVSAAQRTFRGDCPKCGRQLRTHMGHHSTYGEKDIDKRYPKRVRGLIREQLTPENARRFRDALDGRILATDADLALWDGVLSLQPSSRPNSTP